MVRQRDSTHHTRTRGAEARELVGQGHTTRNAVACLQCEPLGLAEACTADANGCSGTCTQAVSHRHGYASHRDAGCKMASPAGQAARVEAWQRPRVSPAVHSQGLRQHCAGVVGSRCQGGSWCVTKQPLL